MLTTRPPKVPEASMLTTRPPKPLGHDCTLQYNSKKPTIPRNIMSHILVKIHQRFSGNIELERHSAMLVNVYHLHVSPSKGAAQKGS
jgi:hypothetical protein